MAKKPMSDAQKYRRADARGRDSLTTGVAKTVASNRLFDAGATPAAKKVRSEALDNLEYKGKVTGMKKGGKVESKEGTAKDMREDKAMAKKRGMTMAQWEKSAADKKHDAPKKMAGGGVMRGAGAAVRGKNFSRSC